MFHCLKINNQKKNKRLVMLHSLQRKRVLYHQYTFKSNNTKSYLKTNSYYQYIFIRKLLKKIAKIKRTVFNL
jgi:hypothetical protein